MSDSWVVAQSAQDVEDALAAKGRSDWGDLSYLATTPEARFELESRGLPFRTVHEYASADENNSVAWRNYGRMRDAVAGLEDAIHSMVPELPHGFTPFHGVEHGFKHLADSLSFASAELLGFVKKESPERLIFWPTPVDGANDTASAVLEPHPGAAFSIHPSGESIVSTLLGRDDCWERVGVATLRMPRRRGDFVPAFRSPGRSTVRRWLNPNRIAAYRALRSGFGGALLNGRHPRLLVIGTCDNQMSFIKYSQAEHSARVDWWTQASHNPVQLPTLLPVKISVASAEVTGLRRAIAEAAELAAPQTHWRWTETDEVRIGEILWERFMAFWRERIPQLLSLYLRALSYFAKRRPIAVLCDTVAWDRVQTILQAARQHSVPFVAFQHGGSYGYMDHEWLRLSDLRAQVYAGYGPRGCDYLNDLARRRGIPPVALSIGWERGAEIANSAESAGAKGGGPLREVVPEDQRRTVVYAPAGYKGDTRYGPYRDVRDAEYLHHQLELIQALHELPNTRILVKPHPKDKVSNPLDRWITRQADPNLCVVRGRSFEGLLASVDAVVVDCPSTVFIEALAAGKPTIFADFGVFKVADEGRELLREAAEWVELAPRFRDRVKDAVERAIAASPTPPGSNAFLSAFANLEFRPDLLWRRLEELTERAEAVA